MKKAVILPLVAAISGVLVGCGGSSSGGGGKPSYTTFNFSFATGRSVDSAKADTKCTIYGRDKIEEKVLNYYTISDTTVAEYVVGYISNSDGTLKDGYLYQPQGNGLSFNIEDIPEDGFFTIQEYKYGKSEILATTFSREFLADESLRNATFGMDKDVSNSEACIQSTVANYVEKDFALLRYSNATTSTGTYVFKSIIDEFETNNYELLDGQTLSGYQNEPTIIAQYRNDGHLNQYGVANWGSSPVMLEAVDVERNIVHDSNFAFDDLTVDLVADGFSYPVLNYGNDTSVYYAPAQIVKGEHWVFTAAMQDISDWTIDYGNALQPATDINIALEGLIGDAVLPSTKPTTDSNVQAVIIKTGVNVDSDNGFQRVAYRTAFTEGNTNYSVTHKLYTKLQSDVVVPNLAYGTIPQPIQPKLVANDSSSFNRTLYVQSDQSQLIDAAMFMGYFSHGADNDSQLMKDINGLVISEKQLDANTVHIEQQHRVKIQRFD